MHGTKQTRHSSTTKKDAGPHRGRVEWIDAARGLCIILVIIGHTIYGMRDGKLIPQQGMLADIAYMIYTFHMAAFFVLSGLVAQPSVKKNPRKFFGGVLTRIVYPYFVWGVIQISIINLMGDTLNHPAPFDPHEYLQLFWGNISQFWFLKTLFLIHALYLTFNKYVGDNAFLLACIVLRGAAELLSLPGTMTQVFDFAIFYALGVAASEKYFNWPARARATFSWAIGLGLIWLYLAITALRMNEPVIAGLPLSGGMLAVTITGCLFIFALAGMRYIRGLPPLIFLGQHTLPIYLLHVLCVAGTRIFLVKVAHLSDVAVILPVAMFAGLLGPLAIREVVGRLRLRGVLGLN